MAVEVIDELSNRSLWRVRLSLALRGTRENWRLFARNKIGLIGLGIIIFYVLLAAAHPILMRTVWHWTVFAGKPMHPV